MVSVKRVNTSGFEWDGKKTEMDYQGDLPKLLPIWLHRIPLKQYVEQFGGAWKRQGRGMNDFFGFFNFPYLKIQCLGNFVQLLFL